MARQFVTCQFHPSDQRTYTYHNDGEPLAPGDRVMVTTARGETEVEVVSVNVPKPAFATKPISGRCLV